MERKLSETNSGTETQANKTLEEAGEGKGQADQREDTSLNEIGKNRACQIKA